MKKLEILNISKTFGESEVLKNISFDVNQGEFLSILGSSGCGKTTLIRILIGLLDCDNGNLIKDGIDITKIPSSKRSMGIVFQNYALFANMTVLENVKYALTLNKDTKDSAEQIAVDLIEKMGLSEHINRKPSKLSGGQQQRVAIARTLALNPEIILFDEPMSALDVDTRLVLRDEIKNIQKEYGTTIIYITHDQEEAFAMSDRIMIMRDGIIEQIDTPENIVANPSNDYVSDFVVGNLQKKIKSILKYVSN